VFEVPAVLAVMNNWCVHMLLGSKRTIRNTAKD
jgi:hypothetical protein